MASLCNRIRSLQGKRLFTARHHEPFDLVAVDGDSARIILGNSGRTYTINCKQFARADDLGLVTTDVIPDQRKNERIARGRTAYAAAIIRAIAETH